MPRTTTLHTRSLRSLLALAAVTCAAVSALFVAPGAHAAEWSLGTNFGIGFLNSDGDDATFIALPASVGALMPGLRVAKRLYNRHHELYIDTGVSVLSAEDVSTTGIEATGNYQYNFSETRSGPYATGGAGILINSLDVGPSDATAASVTIGVGLGLRRPFMSDRGTLRAEVRYDVFTEGKDGDVVVISDGHVVGVKFGFDLWSN